MRLPIAFAFALLLAACQANAPQVTAPQAGAPQVLSAEFGLFRRGPGGEAIFVPSNRVPLVEGQEYGWVILVRNAKPRLRWREEFTLPAAPTTWGKPDDAMQSVSADRKVSVTEREVDASQGMVSNSWVVVAGDPKGSHAIRVTVEGLEAVVFRFTVE